MTMRSISQIARAARDLRRRSSAAKEGADTQTAERLLPIERSLRRRAAAQAKKQQQIAAEEARWNKKPAATVSEKKPTYNNSYAWSGYSQTQKPQTPSRSSAAAGAAATGAAAGAASSYITRSAASAVSAGTAASAAAQRAAEQKRLADANAAYIKRKKDELKASYGVNGSATPGNSLWGGSAVKSTSGIVKSQRSAPNKNTTLPTTTTTGYKPCSSAKRPDPAGFVSTLENFKIDKNPFFLVKPDGTSDLSPEQQEEAAAIFDDVFDGESYLNFKYKKAAERIGKQLLEGGAMKGAVSGGVGVQRSTKPQSVRDEIDEQRKEQIKQRNAERDMPEAIRRAEERDKTGYVPETPKLEPDETGQYFSFEDNMYKMDFIPKGVSQESFNKLNIYLDYLRQEELSRLIEDDEYRLSFAGAINKFYKEGIVPEGLGISNKSLSAEIWGHAVGYKVSNLMLQLENDKNNRFLSYSLLSPIAMIGKSTFGVADVGGDHWRERLLWDIVGGEYDG